MCRFNINDAFIGFSSDTTAAVVLQATSLSENTRQTCDDNSPEKVIYSL